MNKINNIEELSQVKATLSAPKENQGIVLAVGMATCGIAAGGKDVYNALQSEIKALGLENVKVISTGCLGYCFAEPLVELRKDGKSIIYGKVDEAVARKIVSEHVAQGRAVEHNLFTRPEDAKNSVLKGSERIALRNCGVINPESLEDYISRDGYAALAKVLSGMSPTDVIAEVKKSGLRGRGGAGFSTGQKWEFARGYASDIKYMICNADEGDPGAFMDRSVLEGDPHSVLEAMAIGGYAIGAKEGVIYVRAEYPLAVKRLEASIADAVAACLLGDNIMGTDFSFHIRLNLGAGAFVCGEETSLINSVEGNRGEPKMKPPFPAEKGLFNYPSNINNVETFANICPIILRGADWFSSIGTEKSKGTKVFALAGKVNNVGLCEVPMGTTLRDIIYGIGGGIQNGKKFKAAQTGGPSGGCIPAEHLDTPIDYESLTAIGSMMGSGGLIVLDEDDCMVNVAKFYLGFTVEESCGKCTPCRVGNKRLYEMLERITDGRGKTADLDALEKLGETIRDCSLCNLGMTAPNPVLSTLRYFQDEYVAHVVDKRCPSHACKHMIRYTIDPEKCTGCTVCARNCPVPCISGERKQPHVIDQNKCTKCGICFSKCPVDAIMKE